MVATEGALDPGPRGPKQTKERDSVEEIEKASRTVVNRRAFLKTAAAAGAALAVAACSPAPTATPPPAATKAPEATKAPAPVPTATTPPKAAAPDGDPRSDVDQRHPSEVSGLDHPWPAACKKYGAEHPEVSYQAGQHGDQGQNRSPWELLALGLAAGNPEGAVRRWYRRRDGPQG